MPFDEIFYNTSKSLQLSGVQENDNLNRFLFLKARSVSLHFAALGLPSDITDVPEVRQMIDLLIVAYQGRGRSWPFRRSMKIATQAFGPVSILFEGQIKPNKDGWHLEAWLSAPEQFMAQDPRPKTGVRTLFDGLRRRLPALPPGKDLFRVYFEGGARLKYSENW